MTVKTEVANKRNLRNVILFFITFLLSAFGYEFVFFMLTVHVYGLSQKALSVGVFTAITFFPKIFSPLYGVLVDKYERKKVLGINAGIVGILIIALGYANNIYLIYAIWFVASIFLMLIMNARTVLMTEIMSGDNYFWGNSFVLSFLNTAKLLGPLMAGLIMQVLDKKVLILFTSLLYFLCMIMSWMIQSREREKIDIKHINDVFHFLKEGMEFIWKDTSIKKMAILGVFWRLFLGMQVSLFVVYVTKYLGQTQVQYGFFMTIIALGSLAGSFMGPFIAKRVKDSVLAMVGLSLHFISFTLLGLTKQYNVSLVISFLSFFIFYVTVVGIHSLRDKSTKVSLRGRVYGSITSLLTPPAMLSMLAGGLLADIYGVENVLIGSGVAALVSVLIIMASFKVSVQDNIPLSGR